LLIGAQFASALADNALLIVAIELLARRGFPPWWAPLLKFGFITAYVVLAPVVGPLADAFPKARVMAAMNGVKVLGLAGLFLALHPVLALAVVGVGAAAYAPAKYGLVTELAAPEDLVAANAWLEVSIVCAVLLGVVAGGLLVSPWLLQSATARDVDSTLASVGIAGGGTLSLSLVLLLATYGLAGLLNLGIPGSGARYAPAARHPWQLLRGFVHGNRVLWRDRDGGLSLAATTLFWGVGATLQFAVLRWAGEALGLALDGAAYLQAAVAAGVIVGAWAAGRWVPLRRAKDLLYAGVALGLLVPLAASVRDVASAALLLALVGAAGGVMVVPLNALLQHRGFVLMSAGRSIAVQGFNENLGVLAMLAGYAALQALEVPIVATLWGLGLAMSAATAALLVADRRARR
jgi:MFS family permease